MDANRVNVYNRLRDFGVPSTVLDNIFKDNSDAQVLINAFEALLKDGHSEDESAKEISEMIFKELDIVPDQSIEVEKYLTLKLSLLACFTLYLNFFPLNASFLKNSNSGNLLTAISYDEMPLSKLSNKLSEYRTALAL